MKFYHTFKRTKFPNKFQSPDKLVFFHTSLCNRSRTERQNIKTIKLLNVTLLMKLYQPESGQGCKGHSRRYFRNRFRRGFRCLGSIHSDHSHIGPGSIPKDRDISRLQSGCRCRRCPLQVALVLFRSLQLAAERWNQLNLMQSRSSGSVMPKY